METTETKETGLQVFSQREISTFATLKKRIDDEVVKMEKGAMGIATALFEIYEAKLYQIDGYKNIYDYAKDCHGLSRGMVSNIINISKRFAVDGKIPKEISTYGVKALVAMKDYDDEELFGEESIFHITPEMTAIEIVNKISDYENTEETKTDSTVESADTADQPASALVFEFPAKLQDFRTFFNANMANIKALTVTLKDE